MRTVNKVLLIGNVTKDPFIKVTANDKKVAMFTVATNRYFKNSRWEISSEAEYSNCITWGNLAERAEKSLLKWKLVYVEWRLKTRVIDKEDGTKLYKTEVVVSNLIFLNKREDFAEGGGRQEDHVDDIELDDIDIDDKF